MNTAQGKLAFQVQFWGLIGPLVALITLFVILIKAPSQAVYLSLATIMGLLASWKWKLQGAILSFGSILVLYLYNFSEINPDEHLWHIGMNLSIVMGFVITALSLQEVESLLHPLDGNFSSDVAVDADQAVLEINALKKNIEEQELYLAELKAERDQKTAQIISYESLVNTFKSESLKSNKQHEKLLEEFFDKQQQLSQAEEKLHEAKTQIKDLLEKQLLLESKPVESQSLPSLPFDHTAYEELKNSNEILSRERGRLESLLFRIQIDLHQKTQELASLPLLQSELSSLKQEKELLEQTLKEAEYRQQELENKLYEKAKEIESLAQREVIFDNNLLEELKLELQRTIQTKEETASCLEAVENQLNEEKNRTLKELAAKEVLTLELNGAIKQRDEAVSRLEVLKNELNEEINKTLKELAAKEDLALELNEAIKKRDEAVSLVESLEKQLSNQMEFALEATKDLEVARKKREEMERSFEEIESKLHMEQSLVQEQTKAKEILAGELLVAIQKRDEAAEIVSLLKENLSLEITQKNELENLLKEKNALITSKPNLSFDLKKIEGKYNQLREQFEEKSEVLHETRKELFKKEESLLQLKMELAEKEKYYYSDSEHQMQTYLLSVIEESNQLQQEINQLNEIINQLSKPN